MTEADDRKQEMHVFGCGCERRATRKTIREQPDKCYPCRQREYEANRPAIRAAKRREQRAAAAEHGPRPTPSPAQRKAQQSIVALAQPGPRRMTYDPATGELRFAERHSEFGTPLAEIAEHLDVLNVPFNVLLSKDGFTAVLIARSGHAALIKWLPALARKIEVTDANAAASRQQSTVMKGIRA